MSFSIFLPQKNAWLTKAFSLFFALCLVIGAFAGCKDPNDGTTDTITTTATLAGTWTSGGGDNFTVNVSDNTFVYWYGAGSPDYGASMDFAGTITDGDSLASGTGYLTVHLTDSGSYNTYTAGTYIRVHWKNLTDATVQQSGPYLPSGDNSGAGTAAAAKTKFTVENGYFGYYGIYRKQ